MRKTARQIRDLEIPDKCRDGLEKAGAVAKDGYKKAEGTLKDAEAAFIFTEWEEITSVPLSEYKKLMKTPFILDGRNCYTLEEAEEAQVDYVSIGRKEIKG